MKLTHILTAHIWNAGIEWYDYLDCIEFYEDGRGQMCYGDNQCLRSDVYFVYHFIDGQTIVFEYLTASQGFRGRTFELTDENASKIVHLTLSQGTFEIDAPYISKCVYSWRLEFEQTPFPKGWGPPEDIGPVYYGRAREAKKAA